MHITAVLAGAPAWVYVLLLILVALGIRRLKTRDIPVVVALIPVVAFSIWSLIGLAGVLSNGLHAPVLGWIAGLAAGIVGALLVPEARGLRLAGNRLRQPGSWSPLILYLAVFAGRFACGAWAAIVPVQATLAITIGMAIGAAMTGRLIVSVVQWRQQAENGKSYE